MSGPTTVVPPACSSPTSAAWSKEPQGRGARQPVPGRHPRGRRDRLRARAFRDDDVPGPPIRSSTCGSSSSSWPRRPRDAERSSTSAQGGEGDSSLEAEVAPPSARADPGARARRCIAASSRAQRDALSARSSCSPTSRCWRWSTSTRPAGRPDAIITPSGGLLEVAEVFGAVRPARGRSGPLTPTTGEMLEGLGLGEAPCSRFIQAAYHTARSANLPHHRREGEPRPGPSGWARTRRSAQA